MKMLILKGDLTTPLLRDVQASLKPGSKESLKLRKGMAFRLETLTREHITKAAKTRHKTADRLSATHSGYLAKKTDTVESTVTGNADGAILVRVYGDIFARVDGPVDIKPRRKKWLAIPAVSEAYGRRPGEFETLRFIKLKGDLAALVFDEENKAKEAKGRQKFTVIYWLKKGVTLPQDRGLLPTEGEYLTALESAADDYLADLARRAVPKF